MVDSSLRTELLVDRDVDDELEHQLVAEFGKWGFPAESRRQSTHRGPTELGWLVLAALPLQAFLSGLGAEAIKDIYASVKKLARRKISRNGQLVDNRRPLVLHDTNSGLQVVLEDDLPIEAYQQLIALDLKRFQAGPLHYDRHRRAWRSELDEAAG